MILGWAIGYALRCRDLHGVDKGTMSTTSSERASPPPEARSERMERYAADRIREMDVVGGGKRRRGSRGGTPEAGGAKEEVAPARTGKRVRRRPQRWEGERAEYVVPRVATRPSTRAQVENAFVRVVEEASTASVRSADSAHVAPSARDPFVELEEAVHACQRGGGDQRSIVQAFHAWQLRCVSKQSAHQKALHIFLKRRLRKRTSRAPEYDRCEEEALRNARGAPRKPGESDVESGEGGGKDVENAPSDDDTQGPVPMKVRLPLDAYLPRRIRSGVDLVTASDIINNLPQQPHLPGAGDGEKWMALPTVVTASDGSREGTADPDRSTDLLKRGSSQEGAGGQQHFVDARGSNGGPPAETVNN